MHVRANAKWVGVLAWVLGAMMADAAVVAVGSGSYTTTFPGVDVAGRNGVPGGTPQVSGPAVGRPVPTNDWWSALLKQDHAPNLFPYPMALRTLPGGLDVGLIVPASGGNGSSQPLSDISPVVVGVSGLSASRATVHDYSDWTVTVDWRSADRVFQAKVGMGMPFVYFRKEGGALAQVTVKVGTVTVAGEILLIEESQGGANFAVYGPAGAIWSQSGDTYTSNLNGKDYWSLAILPEGPMAEVATAWRPHAYVEPVNTEVSWAYDAATSVLRTEYTTTVTVHEGEGTTLVQGLLPHQWAWLSEDSPSLSGDSLSTIRGEMKLLLANAFATERRFHGILPTLPAVADRSAGFDPALLQQKIALLEDEVLATWTDSYNEGQVMNRLIQTARIAHEVGAHTARDKLIATIKERLEDWLTAEAGEVAFLFHYQPAWSALIGYPAGHGQDTNLNDHHFHWGYFIHAAAFLEQFEPGWAEQWGGMVNLLVRDAASPDRSDPLFPFLRSFSPFAGHAWANGFATFPFGNDQESSSESMQFNSALIHWGAVTGDTAIRDLGIYLYTTEQSAIEEYWFDVHQRTFKPGYGFALASRIWGNGYDNQTFWTSDIAAAYGIELYPIHGGSLYLAHQADYAERLWSEMAAKTGILSHQVNPNLWHDVYWQFLAFTDASAAIALYDANPGRELKFGVSDAHTYHWLHAMNALGRIDASITADDPLAVAFNQNGTRVYVAHNYTDQSKTVRYSDGATLTVGPRSLASSMDLSFAGTLRTPFAVASAGNTIPLTVDITGDESLLTRIEMVSGDTVIGVIESAPFTLRTEPLSPGVHRYFARLVTGDGTASTNPVTIVVGESLPYQAVATPVPGTLEAGAYDRFEGAIGQGITYFDTSVGNNGDFRVAESVDAFLDPTEGAVVGWIGDGEWIDYTVEVATDGLYAVEFRYASGNPSGGGPFIIEQDGRVASSAVTVTSTGGWNTFRTETLNNVALRSGRSVLRLRFTRGELNLGRLTFRNVGSLAEVPPRAVGTGLGVITAPASHVDLSGSGSTVSPGRSLQYLWEQVAGPTVVSFSDAQEANPRVSGLTEDGMYWFRLTVSDGLTQDFTQVKVRRGEAASIAPTVTILEPSSASVLTAGQPVQLSAFAADADGQVTRVDFFIGDAYLGTVAEPPYAMDWYPPVGSYTIRAEATDEDGLTARSAMISVTSNAALPCSRESSSGDFAYTFVTDESGTSVVFEPLRSGVGSSIVLFYHGTGSGPWPGQIISPGTPVDINATEGQTIGFYFTYNVPEGGERNTIAEGLSFKIGSCGDTSTSDPSTALAQWRAAAFSSAELADAALDSTLWGPSADPDADGVSNLWEFLAGSDPRVASVAPVEFFRHPHTGEVRLRMHRRQDVPESALLLQFSDDLVRWQSYAGELFPFSLREGILTEEVPFEAGALWQTRYWRLVFVFEPESLGW